MIDYKSSFKLPFQDVMKYIIGIALSILPIINFFAFGYILEVSRLSMRRKFILPEWKKPGRLFLDGLLYALVYIIYMLPLLILTAILAGLSIIRSIVQPIGNSPPDFTILFAQLGPLWFTVIFLAFVTVYILPAAVLIFVDSGKFGHAFNIIRVINISFSKHYSGPWIISMASMFLIYLIAITLIPYIGPAIAAFTSGVISYSILAQAYANAKHHI